MRPEKSTVSISVVWHLSPKRLATQSTDARTDVPPKRLAFAFSLWRVHLSAQQRCSGVNASSPSFDIFIGGSQGAVADPNQRGDGNGSARFFVGRLCNPVLNIITGLLILHQIVFGSCRVCASHAPDHVSFANRAGTPACHQPRCDAFGMEFVSAGKRHDLALAVNILFETDDALDLSSRVAFSLRKLR